MSQGDKEGKPNYLIHETSPYLLQHAYNPVEWYPWSDEALQKARDENKPILLSIGYSACHWCHVMERESFEDAKIAALMNEHFVNIKVDREERPDLDDIYQTAGQILTGQGGWPLTVFLKPDQRPFFAGTYFPPDDRYGRPGFARVLTTLAQLYRDDADRVEKAASQLVDALQQVRQAGQGGRGLPGRELVTGAVGRLRQEFDTTYGGFGTQPKFPTPHNLELFLREARAGGNDELADMVAMSLRRMARGGIYDQLGGGFHRYSVDQYWLVPHFEKMLYDNALLPPLYLQAFQWFEEPLFEQVVRETLDYVIREMTSPAGAFYSTQDADSEGEEGKFFVWTPGEIKEILGEREGAVFCDRYGVTEGGNFEGGRTVLHVQMDEDVVAERHDLSRDEVRNMLFRARQKLFEAREGRIKPFRDEKILTGWNGLMMAAFAQAGQVLEEPRYVEAARQAATFVTERFLQGDGRLLRVGIDPAAPGAPQQNGTPAKAARRIYGYLEDYAGFTAALLDLYEATFEQGFLTQAQELAFKTIELFWDDTDGGFFLTPADHEPLIHRPKDVWDQSVPSGNGMSAMNLVRLQALTGDERFGEKAEQLLQAFSSQMERNPWGCASLLCALDFYAGGAKEIVVVGGHDTPERESLLSRIHQVYLPNKVLCGTAAEADGNGADLPLLEGRNPVDGKPTVYVCENFTCSAPVTRWEELEPLLKA